MIRALVFASLLLAVASVAVATPATAQPDPCGSYGACVFVCVDDVSQWCGGLACVGFSKQIPVCVKST